MDYLKIPLDFSDPTGIKLKRFNLEDSIAQNIMMLVVSHHGEVVGKEDYGSIIWELEFNQLVKISAWEESVRESLQKTINKYEKRLKDIVVDVTLSEIDDDFRNTKNAHIRRKAKITVNANLAANNLPFSFGTLVYISPLSQ